MKAVIRGRRVTLRLVEISDVDFILLLRSNERKTKFLHSIDTEIEK
ncbi:GNAT family N-acetyltransferase [Helicobacter trogontum]|nr:hypothetical protein [Helicobacter trogontum]MCI5786421.1 hypothetical protein [Helicobacter trogontum]MDY5184916.1 hypothetical protein [Helicobacter trogontum]